MAQELIKVAHPFVGEEEVEAVRRVLMSGRYVSGPEVEAFEQEFAEYLGVEHAIALNSGTAALHLALEALGVGPGHEVIVPPLTFFSSVTAVMHQSAVPIFADISLDTFCLDPADVRDKITRRTRVVLPVHIFGNACDMEGLKDALVESEVPILEDAAQAHGTEYRGRKVGSLGVAGAFSFFATKHMTTGEGGMVVTNDRDIAERVRLVRSHGLVGRDDHVALGFNFRMSEMAAAMGRVQLGRMPNLNEKRIANSLQLFERLADVPWAGLPKLFDHVKHTFFWAHVLVDEKALGLSTPELVKRLREHGVEVRQRYQEPLYKQKLLLEQNPYRRGCPFQCGFYDGEVDYGRVFLPNVEKVAGRLIGLPNHPGLTQEQLDRVVDVVRHIHE